VAPGDKNRYTINHFDFTQLGVRVPAVIVSPFIPRNTVDHTVYDHTSVLKTLERVFGLDPLTERDKAANDFRHLLSLASPRDDCPAVLPDVPTSDPGWDGPQQVPGVEADRGPALAAYGDRLWMAWKSAGGGGIQYATYDGTQWAGPTRIGGASTSYSPALAVLNGTLYMAWLSVGDGAGWWAQTQIEVAAEYSARSAVEVFDGRLYLAWQGGADSATGIQVATYNWGGGTIPQAPTRSTSTRGPGADEPVDPTLLAFAHIAMLRSLSRVSPADVAARERIIERFRGLRTQEEAMAYVKASAS
jgi:hypothetical protein